ncbi:hypothetical protein NLJ89_g427 [Agrocybe chaxingu]|uniref:C3H1-type domain-containing protein n=1 Tax=Agrocybe chaxingu TaxID=84603 RepID=A0A9W8N1W2_9AGAR|nr:hypothetical protein NLJ89_g427 [Agrocybe chaxingu]
MATQPVGEANQQLWDETLNRLLALSSATVRRNTDLENRVAELEVELLVWKQAHSVALEASEREVKAHNVQIAALNRQISNLDTFKTHQNALILCVINGDELVFNRDLLTQGYAGGRAAAQQLTQAIAAQLSNEEVHVYGRLSFWITITFQAFLAGFTQASPRFSTIDAGFDSVTYMSTFGALEKDQMLGKIVLLYPSQSSEATGDRPNVFSLPRLTVEGLWLTEKLPRSSKKLTPLTTGPYNGVSSNGGLISPQSPARSVGRPIDPSLPLHKQNPPPCNEHYLMSCSKGAGVCKYSHDYILTPEQLVSLANNAKKAPCNWLKNGVHCPYGDKCCWGHVCPNGPKCFHLSKGKCWFKGEAMHPEPHTTPPPS